MNNNINKKKETKQVKHRKPNQRQKIAVREMIKTNGNKTQSLINAGYSKNYAEKRGHNMLEEKGIKQDYERKYILALKKAGVDDESLARVQQEGLEANKVFTFQGQVIEPATPVPDHFIRQKFLDTANKVRGDLAPEQHEHSLKRETAEEAFAERVRRRRELEAKASSGNGEKPVEVSAEVVDDSSKEAENESEVTHKKDNLNETT